MSAWAEQDILELVCARKWAETADCVSFELASPDASVGFDFKPGQFASLGFDIAGQTEYRAYSISSLPQQSVLRFTVKRVAGGKVSGHVLESLSQGDVIRVMKPQGLFNNVDCAARDKVVLISAGCGITPVMSMARSWLEQGNVDIDFLHVARSLTETIYANELEQLAQRYSQFHLKLLLKEAGGTQHAQGRLDQSWLNTLIPDLHERTVYLCGPVGFMQDVKCYLEALDFNMQHFYQESFTPTVAEHTQASVAESVRVRVDAFGADIEAPSESFLLEALETGQLPIIAACRSGICGSCKCRVTSGTVRSHSQETLSAEEIEQGYVLACSTVLESDVEIALN
ncbi:2Fe-2S iron-sulfur cluster-binding protein [Vibrio fluvialis]|uniref:2Fe-2S iron-sulfur cluster-binding protein n=1 Tax=Vibrio fluvialis TaxID=676 RepID=UPI001C9DCE23|nr:hybrid-cluster NAD(P)-dependent oxidoreductase [Vibrio fluvialis]MBY8071426.1 hybrid-cluster NAD(P)-dependent oxidoreductase [Vibrio fluvialis]